MSQLPTNEHRRYRSPKPSNQHKSNLSIFCKKNKFLFVKLKGLGCEGSSSSAALTPAIIRSAADWEDKGGSRSSSNKKRQTTCSKRVSSSHSNVVVDVPDVCCTPPGIGIATTTTRNATASRSRSHRRKHCGEGRRNEDDSRADIPTIISSGIGSRTNLRSAGEIIEMFMSQQALVSGRILEHQNWRLNVDDMSYEELVDLSDRIGYVGTGLQEQEIYSCLRIFKHFNPDSTSLLLTHWICSICQEKCRREDDIGTLGCGHHHHLQCIKQWLLHKNACPVCKSAAMPDKL